MRRTLSQALVLLGLPLLLAAPVTAQQFTMKLSSPTANDSTLEYMKAFKAGVEERSKGRIKVELYPANQLGQIPATVDGVALGTIEMTVPAIGFFIGIEPRFQTLETSGLFESMAHGNRVLGLATFGEGKGVEPLFTAVYSENSLITAKPVRSLDDFKGLKVRVAGAAPLYTEPFKRVGALPLAMPLGEVLPALQNRGIDAATLNYPVVMAFKYYDVTKTMTRIPGGFTLVAGLVNRRFMKSLGPELEAIVREESLKAEAKYREWNYDYFARSKEAWEKIGGTTAFLPADDARKFQAEVDATIATVVAKNARMKDDYEALVAAAKTVR
jgi:TRAP-type transport system periplasmic protein